MKKFSISILLVIMLIFLCGCSEVSEESLQKEKVNSELEYLESRILFIVNQYFNGDYYDETENLTWDTINRDFSLVTQNKSVMVMDLAAMQTDGNLIVDFENIVISTQSAISSQNISDVVRNLCDLYRFIPEFSRQTSQDEDLTKIRRIKCNLLYSNYCALINDFEATAPYIEEIEKVYAELVQSKTYLEKNSYKINRKYVEIQEYKLAIQNQDLDTIIYSYFELLSFI